MKILEIGTGYTSIPAQMGAATEIVIEELTRAMQKQGYSVNIIDIKDENRVLTNLPIEEVYMPRFLTSTDTKLGIIHKLKRILYSISLTYKLCKIIKSSNESIVLHFHNQYNLFFFLKLASKSIRNKVIIGYTVHSHVWFGNWNNIKKTVYKRYFQEIYCCQKANIVFTLNDTISKMLVEHCQVPPTKIVKVINGVNIDIYNELSTTKEKLDYLRTKYNLQNKKVIFQVGSICERKNQLGTLKLLLPLMKEDINLVMIYAGGILDPVYANNITQLAIDEGVKDKVIYLGEIAPGEELNSFYSLSDITFMNSQSEAFALVIAESLSAKRPIFINNNIIFSLHFLQEKEGEGIICIKETFKEDLKHILYNKEYYKKMQEKGRAFIINDYSWDVASLKYINAFKLSIQ